MLRRNFLSAFSVTAAGGLALGATLDTAPAGAMSMETRALHPRYGLPAPSPGALDWDLLAQAGETRFIDGELSRFPAAIRTLQGREVMLQGYMLPFREAPAHAEFLLGALQFHCGGCMMGDLARIVAVKARRAVALSDAPLLLQGRLRLIEQDQSPLFFRLEGARPAAG